MDEGRCEIRLTRRYDASAEEVWQALADPRSLERWLKPPTGVVVSRREEGRSLELDWGPPGEEPSVVSLAVRAEGEQTVLVVEHRRLEAARGMRYLEHWPRALARLEDEVAA